MGAIIGMAIAAAITFSQVDLPKKVEFKPCDAKTGCVHPNFK